MKWFKNIFRRKKKQEPQPLRIDGIPPAPMTAEPDDAELAAQALLEMMAEGSEKRKVKSEKFLTPKGMSVARNATANQKSDIKPQTSEYYHQLAERIRTAQEAAKLRTMRFVAFVEEKLKEKDIPLTGAGSLGLLEAELYKRLDVIERVGGELKRRWQHCLADVTVRLMQATSHTEETTTDDTEKKDEHKLHE